MSDLTLSEKGEKEHLLRRTSIMLGKQVALKNGTDVRERHRVTFTIIETMLCRHLKVTFYALAYAMLTPYLAGVTPIGIVPVLD